MLRPGLTDAMDQIFLLRAEIIEKDPEMCETYRRR